MPVASSAIEPFPDVAPSSVPTVSDAPMPCVRPDGSSVSHAGKPVRAHDRDDGPGRASVQAQDLQHLRGATRHAEGAAQCALRDGAREHAALRCAVEDDVRRQPRQREAHMGAATARRDVRMRRMPVPHRHRRTAAAHLHRDVDRVRGRRQPVRADPAAGLRLRAAAADRGNGARERDDPHSGPLRRARATLAAHSRSSSAQRIP